MKSKGMVTYWALRFVGNRRISPDFPVALSDEFVVRLIDLKDKTNKIHRRIAKRQLELVRVEVTPV